jgi:hypothetical protein
MWRRRRDEIGKMFMTCSTTLRVATVFAVLVGAGCSIGSDGSEAGGFREALGLNAGAPDEFLIIANDPLQLPPSFELARPTPGTISRVAPNPEGIAYTALFQTDLPQRLAVASPGETVLLTGAGITDDNSSIRAILAEEAPEDGSGDFGLTSIFGLAIPLTLGDLDSILESRTEVENLRQQGYLTPALPPKRPEDQGQEAE